MGAVFWAEAPEDDGDDAAAAEAHGEVDESFASRRLRRWLKGMFGGDPAAEERADDEQDR
jgi:hypothetical protein